MGFGTTNIDGMLDSYSAHLHQGQPDNAKRFDGLRVAERDAAIAEAVVFATLQGLNVNPQINDDVTTGGADFLCCASRSPLLARSAQDQFIVEATCLNPDAVTSRSKIPNAIPEEISGGAFGLVTQNIYNKAKDKATQLGGYPMPRILAIASAHQGVAVLFNSATAKYALVSDPYWKQEIGCNKIDDTQYTALETSVFIKPGPDGTIVPCRQSISAILLIAVYGDKSQVWGILHPQPAYPLNINFLPNLPFVRISPWPVADGKIMTEWVIASPEGFETPHFPIRPSRRSARSVPLVTDELDSSTACTY